MKLTPLLLASDASLLNNPSFARLNKPDQHLHIVSPVRFRLQFFQRLRSVQLRGEQDLVGAMNFRNPLLRESAPLQSDFVHEIRVRFARGRRHREGQHILRDGRSTADIRMRANAHKLMDRAQRSHNRPLFDHYVASKCRAVHQHDVITNDAVMPDMRVRHDQQMASDLRQPPAFQRATIERHIFADLVVIADLKTRRLTFVGHILWRQADRAEGEKVVIGADPGWPFNRDMRLQPAILPQFHVSPDHTIRADHAGSGNLRRRINDGGGVDIRRGHGR